MREEFLALFRDTQRQLTDSVASPAGNPPGRPPGGSAATGERGPTAAEPSALMRRFLGRARRSPERAPSGIASLDTRLSGGFEAGAHLVTGQPGVGKAAFLESVAWEAVSSGRPVLFYAWKEGSIGAWERLICTLGDVLGPGIPLDALRARPLAPNHLETITRLDLALQASVLPYLSLIDTVPAHTASLSTFIGDVRSRAEETNERHGRIPLLLVDDLEQLLPLFGARPLAHQLSRLNDALVAESIPGLFAMAPPDGPDQDLERLPVRTVLNLVSVSASATEDMQRVDLEVRAGAGTGWTGTLPLLRRSGLFADSPEGAASEPVNGSHGISAIT
jgi:hypothetical protein